MGDTLAAMIDALIFDFDGVVVDSEPLHHLAYLRVLGPLGVDYGFDVYQQRYIAFDDRDNFRQMAADFGFDVSGDKLEAFIAEKAQAFEAIVAEGLAALPGAVELMREARDAMPVAICSGALRSDIEAILPGMGDDLLGGLNTMVTADDVERSKPDPACYALTAQQLGVEAAHCVAIEDTPAGLTAARGAGMQTLAVTNSFPREALTEYADRVVDTLDGVGVQTIREWFG